MEKFVKELEAMSPTQKGASIALLFRCLEMGLWNPATPDVLQERIDCRAGSTRNQIVPRWLVEKEIRLLADAAGQQIPALKNKADWGSGEKSLRLILHSGEKATPLEGRRCE